MQHACLLLPLKKLNLNLLPLDVDVCKFYHYQHVFLCSDKILTKLLRQMIVASTML